jgi:hypothetical protein
MNLYLRSPGNSKNRESKQGVDYMPDATVNKTKTPQYDYRETLTVWQRVNWRIDLRNAQNPNEEKPTVRIDGVVNEKQGLQALQNRATNNSPDYLSGFYKDYRPRSLPEIREVHKMR